MCVFLRGFPAYFRLSFIVLYWVTLPVWNETNSIIDAFFEKGKNATQTKRKNIGLRNLELARYEDLERLDW